MNLNEVLEGFNSAINEEQAWAICHQHAIRVLDKRKTDYSQGITTPYAVPTNLKSIFLGKDGEVTIVGGETADTEKELVETFGKVLYEAWDYGIDGDDENHTSPELERLIERMVLCYDGVLTEEDDEGYDAEDEMQSLDHGPCTLNVVVKICGEHLEDSSKANDHYRAVCRALITEALDLKSFLERVAKQSKVLKEYSNINNNNRSSSVDDSDDDTIPKLHFTEWAQMWIQVVSDLRFGIKLKKVEGYTRNVEYELTPYEILMQDIREQKYALKKVAINGEIPLRVKLNAHDIILDFIKSRPSLKPSASRKLRPLPPRSKSIHELLLEQIHDNQPHLRHVDPPDDSPMRKRKGMDDNEHSGLASSKSCDFSRCGMDPSVPSVPPRSAPQRRRLEAPRLDDFPGEVGCSSDSESDSEDESSFAIDSILTDDLLSTTANEDSMVSSPFKRNSITSSARSSGTSGVSSNECDDVDALSTERIGFKRNMTTVREKRVLPFEPIPSPIYSPAADTFLDTVPPLASYSNYSGRNIGIRRANSMNTVRATVLTGNANVFQRPTPDHERLSWRQRHSSLHRQSPLTSSESMTLPPTQPQLYSNTPLAKRDRRDLRFGTENSTPKRAIRRAMSERRVEDSSKQTMSNNCSLTVEELMHIRHVLARAELERYMTQRELYENLKKGKICFNCRVRKFSVFCWASTCEICKQKICSKCMRKVRAPIDEPMWTPVHALSPSLNPSGEDKSKTKASEIPAGVSETLAERLSSNTSSSVLRELGIRKNLQSSTQQTTRLDQNPAAHKTRKMDVCEECCDLIYRITQANKEAQISPASRLMPRASTDTTPRLWRRTPHPSARPANGLSRSTSSAAWFSCIPAKSTHNGVQTTRSVQNLQTFAN